MELGPGLEWELGLEPVWVPGLVLVEPEWEKVLVPVGHSHLESDH